MTNKPRIRDWNHRGPFPPWGRRATALWERSGDRGDGPGSAVLTSCQDKWHPQPSPHNSPAAIRRHHHHFGPICFSEGMLHLGQMFPSVCLLTAKNSRSNCSYVLPAHEAARSGCRDSVDDRGLTFFCGAPLTTSAEGGETFHPGSHGQALGFQVKPNQQLKPMQIMRWQERQRRCGVLQTLARDVC